MSKEDLFQSERNGRGKRRERGRFEDKTNIKFASLFHLRPLSYLAAGVLISIRKAENEKRSSSKIKISILLNSSQIFWFDSWKFEFKSSFRELKPLESSRLKFVCTDMSKKSKDRLRDPALYVTMRNHATYPSNFFTYL